MIKIFSLNKSSINNNTTFIIFNYNKLVEICDIIGEIDNFKVYRLNVNRYNNIIKNYNIKINLNNFIPVGDYCIQNNEKFDKIILANKNFITTSNKYKYIGRINSYYFWKAVIKRKNLVSRSFGVVTTKSKIPPIYNIPIIPNSYLVNMNILDNNIISGNEFNVLNHKDDGVFIFIKNKLLNFDENNIIKNNNTSFKYKNKNLIINDLCATYGDTVTLKKCENLVTQRWNKINDKFISILDKKKNKCVSFENNKIKIINCSNNNSNKWIPIKGKNLILKTFNNPWYNDKNIVKNKKLKHKNENFSSNINMIKEDEYINNNTNNNVMLFGLLVLLIIIVIIKWRNKKK